MSLDKDIKSSNDNVPITIDKIPTKSEIYRCVIHQTAIDIYANKNVDVVREKKGMLIRYLLRELTKWKTEILSLPDVHGVVFEDRISVNGSTELRGEAMAVIKSLNGLDINPQLDYVEIAHAPDIVWHKGE